MDLVRNIHLIQCFRCYTITGVMLIIAWRWSSGQGIPEPLPGPEIVLCGWYLALPQPHGSAPATTAVGDSTLGSVSYRIGLVNPFRSFHRFQPVKAMTIPMPSPTATTLETLIFLINPAPPVNASGLVVVEFALPLPIEPAVASLGPKPPMMIEPSASVLLPTRTSDADGAKEIGVPLMVIAGPPGMRV